MTYPIGNVIFGCPFPQGKPDGVNFIKTLEAWIGHVDLDVLGENIGDQESLWNFLYSASMDMDPAGYFGEELYVADGYWELQPEWFQHPVPEFIQDRVNAAWRELPPDVREMLGQPRLAIAWSDS